MKYITKKEIDQIVGNIMKQNYSFETRRELEQHFGASYTKAQKERIWHRYRYMKAGGGKDGREDREKNPDFKESDGRTGD